LEVCFNSSSLGPRGIKSPSNKLLGGIAPHAGYIYSGPCAAHFYARLDPSIERVILLGVNHRGAETRAALSGVDFWDTPLGRVRLDQELESELRTRLRFVQSDDRSHGQEHSIEVQLPFLQTILKEFTFLPIALSHPTAEECASLGEAIARGMQILQAQGQKGVVIASSDLNHYLSPSETERLDRLALEKILALDPEGLIETVARERISMCGVLPAACLLFCARALGAEAATLLKHCHSGDAVPMDEVVGYASVAVEI
jgi:hypothetical protein